MENIEEEIEELHRRLEEDIDNHYNGREHLSEAHHFELWDRMWELTEKKRLVHS